MNSSDDAETTTASVAPSVSNFSPLVIIMAIVVIALAFGAIFFFIESKVRRSESQGSKKSAKRKFPKLVKSPKGKHAKDKHGAQDLISSVPQKKGLLPVGQGSQSQDSHASVAPKQMGIVSIATKSV
ncbi:hypothetical protein HDE_14537 [Halotydeus destructor]|nr:hypothetical protein HDE_14537 [Halotydeus destructor]